MSPTPFLKKYALSLWSQLGKLMTLFGPFVVNSQVRKVVPKLIHMKRTGDVNESSYLL